jgi:ABC-type amino acid transport substrate-binding protein
MSRPRFLCCCLSFCLVCIAALGGQEINARIFQDIKERGTLRVGLLQKESFPFSFPVGAAWRGYDVDLAEGIANTLGVDLRITASYRTSHDLLRGLVDGDIDIALSKYKVNLPDAAVGRFSRPYSYVNYALLVGRVLLGRLRMSGPPEQVLSKAEVTIGTLDDPNYVDHLRARFPHARLRLFSSPEELFANLLEKQLVAGFLDQAEAQKLILDHDGSGLWVAYAELATVTDEVAAVVSWRNSFLSRWIDMFIESIGAPISPDALIKTYGGGVTDGKGR